ncbi:DnaJ domain-containing protein, partial [Baaleninema sp.]|uniref:DnaJ domain-containing protein n=1 Tax=Baaleninema sp. TaxID=3101197 RepID=UPI003D000BB5
LSATLGNIGLVGSFGGVGLGTMPFVAAGVVAGSAAYGAIDAFVEGDTTALGTAGLGAVGGMGVSSVVGGMGVGVGGMAFGIGMGTMATVGGVVGLGLYGVYKAMTPEPGQRLAGAFDAFSRMEERILDRDFYNETMLEFLLEDFDRLLGSDPVSQKFRDWEIDAELEELKAKLNETAQFDDSVSSPSPQFADSKTPPPQATNIVPNDEANDDTFNSWQCVGGFRGHTQSVNDIAISLDGNAIASASSDRTVTVWNLDTQQRTYSFFNSSPVYAVTFDDNNNLLTGEVNSNLSQWNLQTRQLQHSFVDTLTRRPRGIVYAIAVNPTHASIASGGSDNLVRIWHRHTREVQRGLMGHTDRVESLVYTPDGTHLVSGSRDGTVRIWNVRQFKKPKVLHCGSAVAAVAVSADGRTLASGGCDGTVKLWDWQTGNLERTLRHSSTGSGGEVRSLDFHPNGKLLASASDRHVKLWNCQTGECLAALVGTHPVAFAADGSFLVTGSQNQVLKLWRSPTDFQTSDLASLWWQVLGVSPDATPETVKVAYRSLAKLYHPDANGDRCAIDRMKSLNQAYADFLQTLENR